jgi:hypothetical protein
MSTYARTHREACIVKRLFSSLWPPVADLATLNPNSDSVSPVLNLNSSLIRFPNASPAPHPKCTVSAQAQADPDVPPPNPQWCPTPCCCRASSEASAGNRWTSCNNWCPHLLDCSGFICAAGCGCGRDGRDGTGGLLQLHAQCCSISPGRYVRLKSGHVRGRATV